MIATGENLEDKHRHAEKTILPSIQLLLKHYFPDFPIFYFTLKKIIDTYRLRLLDATNN